MVKLSNLPVILVFLLAALFAAMGMTGDPEWIQSTRKFAHIRGRPSNPGEFGNTEDLRKRAEKGDAEAQFTLGMLCRQGETTPSPETEVRRWFRDAANRESDVRVEIGSVEGEDFLIGGGIPRDVAKAADWFRDAAEQGHARAQYNLGLAYGNGEGVPQNWWKASFWLFIAAENGQKEAEEGCRFTSDWLDIRKEAKRYNAEIQRRKGKSA